MHKPPTLRVHSRAPRLAGPVLLAVAMLVAYGCVAEGRATTARPTAAPTSASAPTSAKPAPTASAPQRKPLSELALMAHVQHLASDTLQGRKAGTAHEKAAAEYVIQQLENMGVAPLPDGRRKHHFALSKKGSRPSGESLNVYGFIAAADAPLTREIIVVGAHIDHLGARGERIYPGADDNASGVAVALELARELEHDRSALGRSVLLAFFGSEEFGMRGSKAFVREPPVPLARVVIMVNIDMVGRPLADRAALSLPKRLVGIDSNRSIGVMGTTGRPALRRLVDAACAEVKLQVVAPDDLPSPLSNLIESYAEGRGDNWSFQHAGIPALMFSSGESDDYHLPTDTADRLRPELMRLRGLAIYRVVLALSTHSFEPRAAEAAKT